MTGSLLGPLDYMFGETLRVALMAAVAVAGGVAVAARLNAWTFERAARTWLLVTSLAAIALFTNHNPYGGSGRVVELNPFNDLRVAAHTTGRYRDIVVANIVLFIPLGVALAWRGTRFFRSVAFGAAISITAEVVQYVSNHGRVAQTGDVVVNVAGAVIGWAVFVALTGGWGPLSRKESATARGVVPPERTQPRTEVESRR
jgi:VanZ family protein